MTAAQFLVIDILLNGVLYYLWRALEVTVLTPLAMAGLALAYVSALFHKLFHLKRAEMKRDIFEPRQDLIVAIRLSGVLVDLTVEDGTVTKVFARPSVDTFLDYLQETRVKLMVFEDSTLVTEETLRQILSSLRQEEHCVVTIPTDKSLMECLKEKLSPDDQLEKRLVVVDREDRPECQSNLIKACEDMARPARWRQTIEVLRLAQGSDVRDQLQTVIQME